jgi:drug/metabolite transporter (DMT)-like permease
MPLLLNLHNPYNRSSAVILNISLISVSLTRLVRPITLRLTQMHYKNYLTLFAIGFIWGSQFIFQTLALNSFSPIWLGSCRAVLGAMTLCLICKMMDLKGASNQWRLFTLIGLLEASIPFVLIPWGQQNLTSSITAILMGTIPFYTLILAPLFIKDARLSIGSTLSLIVGFCGLVILFYPELSSGTGAINLVSSVAIIIAAVCFAIALLLLNRIRDEHPLIVARNVLSMASIQLVVIALLMRPIELAQASLTSVLSLLYLGVICAGVVYYLYMMSIKNAGAVFTSMTNYLVPTVGVLIGAIIANDTIQTTTWIALAVIIFALVINQSMTIKNKT